RRLQSLGNSLFVVEHDMRVARSADWIVDLGPAAGDAGGRLLHSGTPADLAECAESETRRFLCDGGAKKRNHRRTASDWLRLSGVTKHNIIDLQVEVPLGVLTVVTGVSGSGKSTLVSQVLTDTVQKNLASRTTRDGGGKTAATR